MENNIKEIVIAKIVGTLVNEGLSAYEAIYVLEQAENTFLDRSYHINSKKKAD